MFGLSGVSFEPDTVELQKLQALEKHLSKCISARRIDDWKDVLREAYATGASGSDAFTQVMKSLKFTSILIVIRLI